MDGGFEKEMKYSGRTDSSPFLANLYQVCSNVDLKQKEGATFAIADFKL